MKPVVFVGPSLSGHPVLRTKAFAWRPPASEGDLYRASLARPAAIGLIDGRFESVPSVWHKEILWALSHGIAVFGAASMGALRAAELDSFGMIGVGTIYEAFRDGRYTRDDEVAILHAPKELRFQALSTALVDIRATLAAARRARIVSSGTAALILRIAQRTFFKERHWDTILADKVLATVRKDVVRFRRWLATNAVDQKRSDALLLLDALRDFRAPPLRADFRFHSTGFWRALQRRHGR